MKLHTTKELEAMTGESEPVLMCHCGTKAFCHRRLVAEWLEKETGEVIEEYGMGIVQKKRGEDRLTYLLHSKAKQI